MQNDDKIFRWGCEPPSPMFCAFFLNILVVGLGFIITAFLILAYPDMGWIGMAFYIPICGISLLLYGLTDRKLKDD